MLFRAIVCIRRRFRGSERAPVSLRALLAFGAWAAFAGAGCDSVDGDLAPYEGDRPLTFVTVTRSFSPDIQWVGGRAAAVGINRGTSAALDSTLVWLVTEPGNTLDSPVRVRQDLDADRVRTFGGTPIDSLIDEGVYTFWVAEKAVFDAGLTPAARDSLNFVSRTDTLDYALSGASRGGLGVSFTVARDQELTDDRFIVLWRPGVPVRQLVIRNGTTGGFSDVLWHIRVPNANPTDVLVPPVVIGQPPAGTEQVAAWPEDGFVEGRSHTVWVSTRSWGGAFTTSAAGYGYITLPPSNFPATE